MPECLPKWLSYFVFPPAMTKSSCCSASSPAFDVVSVSNFSHPNRCVIASPCFNLQFPNNIWGLLCGTVVKNPSASVGDAGDEGWIPGWGRSPGRKWQPTPVFLPRKSHGQRSLVGYSTWGHKELDTTEHAHTHDDICNNLSFHMSK